MWYSLPNLLTDSQGNWVRIISNYKDYYDNAMSYGVDTTQVFVRNEEFVEIPVNAENRHLLDSRLYFGAGTFHIKGKSLNEKKVELNYVLLGFCGMHFLGLRFDEIKEGKVVNSETYYAEEQVVKGFERIRSKHNLELPKGKNADTADRLRSRFVAKHSEVTELVHSRLFQSWFFTYNCPSFAFTAQTCAPAKYAAHFGPKYYAFRKTILLINPCLKEIDFYRKMSPVECYQSINQYRFGVLVSDEGGLGKQSDIQKVQSHGFDLKYGFRKRPNEKL